MSRLLKHILRHAQKTPLQPALADDTRIMTYAELNAAIGISALQLRRRGIHGLALLADNGIPWVVGDLAALHARIPCVPLPHFFSSSQVLHAISDSGADGILTDRPSDVALTLSGAGLVFEQFEGIHGLSLIHISGMTRSGLPAETCKITYTSGTTGEPKGVCLGLRHLETVAESLRQASQASSMDKHLCLTPLSTLLENIGGIYVPLLAGACACVPSLRSVGLGETGIDVRLMLSALLRFDASTAILAPQMLKVLSGALAQGMPKPPHLRFLAVGGAPVPEQMLELTAELGLPVYQGYGLSECASVAALNTPTANRLGSVGRLLPHLSASIAEDGEILIDGPVFLGYTGHNRPASPWPTGDIGFFDEDGYLYVTGRKKDIFITSYGRNVSPEWVEGVLTSHPHIYQAAVFGEGRPWNCAVLVVNPQWDRAQLASVVAMLNRSLPNYARVTGWIVAEAPFSPSNGQSTSNGRLKRSAIFSAYLSQIQMLYEEDIHAVL